MLNSEALVDKIKSLENKHYLLVNRVNLLLREIDNLKQNRKQEDGY